MGESSVQRATNSLYEMCEGLRAFDADISWDDDTRKTWRVFSAHFSAQFVLFSSPNTSASMTSVSSVSIILSILWCVVIEVEERICSTLKTHG